MINKYLIDLQVFLEGLGFEKTQAGHLQSLIVIGFIILLSLVIDIIMKRIIIVSIRTYVKRSENEWDDIFLENKVFNRLAHIAPALVLYYSIHLAFDMPLIVTLIRKVSVIYIIIVSLLVGNSFINSLHDIYLRFPISKDKPIKGYVQVLKLFLYMVTAIILISYITGTRPYTLLAGLGAMAAVLLLIFKDTILGLVASIQISVNNIVKPGDWIEIPNRHVDGNVVEITLNTVKVQNFDNTISTVPTYALVSESFTNWRGMQESEGRRIKRAVNIDMKSVRFLNEDLIKKLRKIQILKPYIDQQLEDIQKFNEENHIDPSSPVNGIRMTNLGTFRKYMEAYLNQIPQIHKELTLLVRQKEPSDKGIPIEIYVFSKEKGLINYENLQADIFDHMLAVIPEFELQVYQSSGVKDFFQNQV
jgi:miniconductance mechanosensitive channel